MKVLVTGGQGFLGRAICQRLLSRGHLPRAMSRRDLAATVTPGLEIVQGDICDASDVAQAVEGVDAVVHLAFPMQGAADEMLALALNGTDTLVNAMARAKVRKLVLASSFSVYDWQAVGPTLQESSPLLPLARDPRIHGGYALAKRAQEARATDLCEQMGVSLTVLRPAMIWGPDRPGLDVVGPRMPKARLWVGPERSVLLTHVDNCASAFCLALERSEDSPRIFNIEDGHLQTVRQYARWAEPDRSGWPIPASTARLLAPAAPLLRLAARRGAPVPGLMFPEQWAARFPQTTVDTHLARQALGWAPLLSFQQASTCSMNT